MKKYATSVLTMCLAVWGCDKPAPPPTAPPPMPQASGAEERSSGEASVRAELAQAHAVSVRGVVRFEGTAPVMREMPNSSCGPGHRNVMEETILVSEAGGLKNCLVYVEGAPAFEGGASLAAPVLDQIGCRYTPHVLGIVVNQPLKIRSSDDTLHNVHYDPQTNPPANFAMVGAGQERTVKFKAPEILKVTCDVHPWMNAWIGVFENPYFAVTGDDGAFEISRLPDGQYKLVAWHERLGKQEQEITIQDGEAAERGFTYRPAAPVAAR